MKIDPEIAELIGAFIGDGYITSENYVVGFAGDRYLDRDYFLNFLYPLLVKKFDVCPRIYFRKDENTIMLKVRSKILVKIFLSWGFKPGIKSRIVSIPDSILKNKKLLNPCLRGIFDTDGCVFYDRRTVYSRPYPRITLQSASITLIEQIEAHLSENFKVYTYKKARDGYRNYVEIYGHKQLEMFLKQIGFSNNRH